VTLDVDVRPAAARTPARPPRHLPPVPAAVRRWSGPALGGLLVALLLGGIAALYGTNLGGWPARSIDEGTYVSQTWSVLTRGELAPYTYWYDHPPLGWLLLSLLLAPVGGVARAANAVLAGREAVLAVHLAGCALLYVWARRIGLGRIPAALAVAAWAASPLTVFFARQVLLDNLAVPLVLGAFALAASPTSRLRAAGGAGVLFAMACLTKETSLLVLPGLALQLWQSSRATTRRYALTLAASLCVLTLSAYLLLALLRGELLPGEGHVSLVEGIAFQLLTRDGTPPLWQGGEQQVTTLLRWLALDPWLPAAGAAALVPALAVRRLRPAAIAALVLAASGATTRYLPAMFVVALLPFAALLAAGLVDVGWRLRVARAPRPLRRPAAPVAVSAAVAAAVLVAPVWDRGLEPALTRDDDAAVDQAYDWLRRHAGGARLLVDEPLRIELVARGGWPEADAVWIYKLDLDPEVAAANPGGWRDFDYVVTTATSRADTQLGEQVDLALARSEPVATFGPPGTDDGAALLPGQERIEIRRVVTSTRAPRPDRPGTAAVPAADPATAAGRGAADPAAATAPTPAPPAAIPPATAAGRGTADLAPAAPAPGAPAAAAPADVVAAGAPVLVRGAGALWVVDHAAGTRSRVAPARVAMAIAHFGLVDELDPQGRPHVIAGLRDRPLDELLPR